MWMLIALAAVLVYREMRRRRFMRAVRRLVRDVIPGQEPLQTHTRNPSKSHKYAKACDPSCEMTPRGCMKRVIDPLTDRVVDIPCDPACCECKDCRMYVDPSENKAICARGMPDNTVQPCKSSCCFHQNDDA